MPNPNHVNPRTGLRYGFEAEQKRKKEADPAFQQKQLEEELALLERQEAAMKARGNLLDFMKFVMPDPTAPGDVKRSSYEPAKVHEVVADILTKFVKQELLHADGRVCRQLIFCKPPRHGKSQLATKGLAAWASGLFPTWDMAIASYSDTMATDFGADIRAIMTSSQFKQAFPEHKLRRGGSAKDNIQTEQGGRLVAVGRGGALTGRGMALGLGDDIFKDFEEARSQNIRDQAWNWFTKVFMTRRMGPKLVMLTMCMTGDTSVLMADGVEKQLKDIRPGDMVASYHRGRLVASKVLNHINNGPDLCFEIKMTSGISVKANERHPFLVDRNGELEWVRLRNLKVSDAIVRVSGVNGPGSFAERKGATSLPAAKDCALATTTRRAGRKVFGQHRTTQKQNETFVSSNATALPARSMTPWSLLKGTFAQCAASLRVKTYARTGAVSCASTIAMQPAKCEGCCATTATLPLGTRKQKRCFSRRLATYAITRDRIASISAVASEDVYDIQVEGTENFIANGLVSHNTRWHSDDVIGRITDPENPHYSAAEAKNWMIIRLPAIAEEDDPLGRAPGDALWPERFDLDFLQSQQRLDPLGFAALYQQRPTVADGVLFRRENIQRYDPKDLPENLRFYCASDHAVGTKQRNDPSCFGKAGVDAQDNLWLTDLFWSRVPTDQAVEAMLAMAGGSNKPLLWWAERGHISASIGPFLRKRMLETGTYINVVEVTPKTDKETRAQSIAARVAMGKVFIPKGPIWDKAVEEMLAFPNGIHDDFVDMLSLFGLGLQSQHGARPLKPKAAEPKFGTLAWVRRQEAWADEQKRAKAAGGF